MCVPEKRVCVGWVVVVLVKSLKDSLVGILLDGALFFYLADK